MGEPGVRGESMHALGLADRIQKVQDMSYLSRRPQMSCCSKASEYIHIYIYAHTGTSRPASQQASTPGNGLRIPLQ